MFGIIIWLSPQAESALIITDGGTALAFGHVAFDEFRDFAVGDLIFAPGLSAYDDEFCEGLQQVTPGFWPEVLDMLTQSNPAMASCLVLKKSGNIGSGFAHLDARNLPGKPTPFAARPFARRSALTI